MSETRKSPIIPIVVAVIAALALTLVLFQVGENEEETASPAPPGAASDAPPETWQELVRREADDPMALGDVDAPVVMVAYSEFQCPFCGKFARDTEPVLVEKYVENGTLRIEWRDVP